jgi:hypothetical protein
MPLLRLQLFLVLQVVSSIPNHYFIAGVIVEHNEEQDENAFLIDIMCQFRGYIVQKKHSEVSKTLEELTFRRRYL